MLPEEWRPGSTLSSTTLRLTPDEAGRLREELLAVVERYREHSEPDPPEGTEIVQFQVQLMPFVRPLDNG
ncbi:hypothetical protein ACFQ1L_00185 [Phytohabitans flavus]|uniref:hypothetical protein n=1 Tax=Phytohabitans flavus TaxID=1076124 RepID=UPI003626FEF0